MTEPRELTDDEVRARFLEHVWQMIGYWEREDRTPDVRGNLEGLAHSLLAAMDGCSSGVPAFVLAPAPHPDDAAFHRSEGENWYPSAGDVPHDIAGSLHEVFYSFDPRRKKRGKE